MANGETWCLDTTMTALVGCVTNADCTTPTMGEICDTSQHMCVGCLADTDCAGSPDYPYCSDDKICVECRTDADCSNGATCGWGSCAAG